MAREIDLIMNAKSAPKELTDAVTAYQKTYNKLLKAQVDFGTAKAALAEAQDEANKNIAAYQDALNRWDVK